MKKSFSHAGYSEKSKVSEVLRELKANDSLFDTVLIILSNTDRHLAQNHLHLKSITPENDPKFSVEYPGKKELHLGQGISILPRGHTALSFLGLKIIFYSIVFHFLVFYFCRIFEN